MSRHVDRQLNDPAFFASDEHYRLFDRMRVEDPLHWTASPDGRGYWSVFRHADIKAILNEQHSGSASDILALHQAQTWRDRLIAQEDAFGQWVQQHPQTDSQQLRALIRQARKDAKPEKPGAAVRHGRAFRDIFQLVRAALSPESAAEEDVPADEVYKP